MAFRDMFENRELDNQMIIDFISTEDKEHEKEFKNLKSFYDFYLKKLKTCFINNEEITFPLNSSGYELKIDFEYKIVKLVKYINQGDYFIISDYIFKKVYDKDNDDKYGLFKFDTLHKISNSNGKIRLNKLVSRDISYDGEKLIEKEPIYYGENFININNYENEQEIRKILTK